jgi:hypothetical protein
MEAATEIGDNPATLVLMPVISGRDISLVLKEPVPVILSLKNGIFLAENRDMNLEGVGEEWDEALQMFMDFFFRRFMTYIASDLEELKPNERKQWETFRTLIPDWQRQLEGAMYKRTE